MLKQHCMIIFAHSDIVYDNATIVKQWFMAEKILKQQKCAFLFLTSLKHSI